MSSLPSGITNREIDALCDHFGGDPIFDCAKCLQEIYDESLPKFKVNGQLVCFGCAATCAMCGEWLDDDAFPVKVYEIRFREWANDGKLSEPHCPKCAADWLIGVFVGEAGTFDSDDYSGEHGEWVGIGIVLKEAGALPEHWAPSPAKAATSAHPVKEAHDAA